MNIFRRGWQENLVFASDVFIIAFSYIAAYFIRFDGVLPRGDWAIMKNTLPLVLIIRIAALVYFKLNKSIWQYASIADLIQILKGTSVGSVFIVAMAMLFQRAHPRSIFIIDWLLLVIAMSGVRFVIRITRPIRGRKKENARPKRRVLIVGAGDAGEKIIRELLYGYSQNLGIVGFVDDNPQKLGKSIHGIHVLGKSSEIPLLVAKYNIHEVIIAIPSLKPDRTRAIVEECMKSGAKYRIAPNIAEIINGTVRVKELREVRLEDLLKREEVILNRQKIGTYITGKTVLITGAGGSIGSELCRQVARFSPRELILFEKAENSLFYIDMELRHFFKDLKKNAVIGDICDRKRVEEVFSKYKPHTVFHAAAHKHVPLMEANPIEAIKNNCLGTKVLAEESINFGVQRFIMLSTDKAVEPTSVMGASKRVAEVYLSTLSNKHNTKFMAVRFGNVIGSEGSVVPTFKKIIERGGPVPITHPDIKRYFMTIPEAAGLVLEAGYMGEGGEIFILEMGKQIKIVDLANDLIRLSGLEPNKDIEIVFTGLRPGEKMYEALVADNERLLKTSHGKIMIVETEIKCKRNILQELEDLKKMVGDANLDTIINKLKEIVPSYNPCPQAPEAPISAGRGKKTSKEVDILIADDEEIIRELLRKFLEGKGYNTFLASSGREALGIIKNNDVRLAIIDIRMPGTLDGIKTLKHIKKKNRDVEVILITGFGNERARSLSKRFGACAYLEKPFDLADINRRIECVLNPSKN
jgi:FlaA1/EpsC-like NDP-sugar epimerase